MALYTRQEPLEVQLGQAETARGVRRSPIYEQTKKLGAVFGEVNGWERPNWYARDGVKPEYEYSYGRQNWFP